MKSVFGHASSAEFTARHIALFGANEGNAVPAQGFDVAAGGGRFPHAHVHGRGGKNRGYGGQKAGGGQIVGQPVGHARQDIGGCRGDDDQIGRAGKLDMADLGLAREIEQI